MKIRPSFSKPARLNLLVASLFLLCALSCPTAASAWWAQRYSGPGHTSNVPVAVGVDAAGNVYVTGISGNSSGEIAYLTVKYDANGNLKWVRRYSGPANHRDEACAMAVDAEGAVYVTGSSMDRQWEYDFATVKYDTNGNRQWVRRYNGPANSWDIARDIAVDADGNVYVVGDSYGGATSYDFVTIKYDANGKRKWVKRYNGPAGGGDSVVAVAVDGAGNVYVTGNSVGNLSSEDITTIKYNANGSEQWVKRYNGPGNRNDRAAAIALDADGAVYVVGDSYTGATGYDYAIVKYDANGNEKWVRQYNGASDVDDHAGALAVDAAGSVCVTGISSSDYYSDGRQTTIKYDSNGSREWIRHSDSTSKSSFSPDIAVDAVGNVYTSGTSPHLNYMTVKYDTNGIRQWVRRYNGSANYEDYAEAIAVDAEGAVIVTGASYGSDYEEDYATVKYDTNGN